MFSKIHYKQRIYSDEFAIMHSESFLQSKTGCKLITIFILIKLTIKN